MEWSGRKRSDRSRAPQGWKPPLLVARRIGRSRPILVLGCEWQTFRKPKLANLTMSILRSVEGWSQAAGAAWKRSDEADDEAAADGADGMRRMSLRPDRGRRAAGNPRVAQVPRAVVG